MWQFIPSTGKNYKLDQNWWLDERRDVIASTSAALDYLQNIYEMHGDWHLALAAYNWGEHAVARAVAKNEAKGLPTDYLSLTMPAETRHYVPRLLAVKRLVADPGTYGLALSPVPNRPYFATSIQDFWKRWHISLTSWLTDYVYTPITRSKVIKINLVNA
jgi:membrane-bound lytic murein transglycosylase D